MQKDRYHLLKRLVAGFTLVVCLWAVGDHILSASPEAGKNALLYTAGIAQEEKATAGPEKVQVQQSGEEKMENGQLPLLDEDEIVPFHENEFPVINATPAPGMDSGDVKEIAVTGGAQIDNFTVKDTTGSGTDLVRELQNNPDVQLKCNGEVEVLLYHTHTTEAYMDSYTGFYYTDMQTRSQNEKENVVAVGEEIKKQLEAAGIGVVHDTTVNDALYTGAYSRSWETIQSNLEKYPTIQITIDIHRDSMTTEEGLKYKPTVEIGGRKAAQIMLLAGCDANGEWGDFPDWLNNLRLDLRVQQKAEELYPGLLRPLSFSNCKYNMNATHGSMLIEVGTEVNTVAEAKYAGKLMGKVLGELLPELGKS